MTAQLSEQALITSASNGDLDAFNQLILNYQNIVYRYASSLTDDPTSAEDITQESFIKAFQHVNTFRGSSFRAWLLTIVRNTSHDKRRWSRRHITVSLFPEDNDGEEIESPAWTIDPNAYVEAAVQQHETFKQLFSFLNELSAEHRNILILIDLHGMDYVEAAQILNVLLGTVKSRLARARIQMRNKLLGGDEYTHRLTKDTLITTHVTKSPLVNCSM